jgi:hypothetical protein
MHDGGGVGARAREGGGPGSREGVPRLSGRPPADRRAPLLPAATGGPRHRGDELVGEEAGPALPRSWARGQGCGSVRECGSLGGGTHASCKPATVLTPLGGPLVHLGGVVAWNLLKHPQERGLRSHHRVGAGMDREHRSDGQRERHLQRACQARHPSIQGDPTNGPQGSQHPGGLREVCSLWMSIRPARWSHHAEPGCQGGLLGGPMLRRTSTPCSTSAPWTSGTGA